FFRFPAESAFARLEAIRFGGIASAIADVGIEQRQPEQKAQDRQAEKGHLLQEYRSPGLEVGNELGSSPERQEADPLGGTLNRPYAVTSNRPGEILRNSLS